MKLTQKRKILDLGEWDREELPNESLFLLLPILCYIISFKNILPVISSFITTIATEKLSRSIPFLMFKNYHLISDLNFARLYLFVLVNCDCMCV